MAYGKRVPIFSVFAYFFTNTFLGGSGENQTYGINRIIANDNFTCENCGFIYVGMRQDKGKCYQSPPSAVFVTVMSSFKVC